MIWYFRLVSDPRRNRGFGPTTLLDAKPRTCDLGHRHHSVFDLFRMSLIFDKRLSI